MIAPTTDAEIANSLGYLSAKPGCICGNCTAANVLERLAEENARLRENAGAYGEGEGLAIALLRHQRYVVELTAERDKLRGALAKADDLIARVGAHLERVRTALARAGEALIDEMRLRNRAETRLEDAENLLRRARKWLPSKDANWENVGCEEQDFDDLLHLYTELDSFLAKLEAEPPTEDCEQAAAIGEPSAHAQPNFAAMALDCEEAIRQNPNVPIHEIVEGYLIRAGESKPPPAPVERDEAWWLAKAEAIVDALPERGNTRDLPRLLAAAMRSTFAAPVAFDVEALIRGLRKLTDGRDMTYDDVRAVAKQVGVR